MANPHHVYLAREGVRALDQMAGWFTPQSNAWGHLEMLVRLLPKDKAAAIAKFHLLASQLDQQGLNSLPLRRLADVVAKPSDEDTLARFAALPEARDFFDYLERALASLSRAQAAPQAGGTGLTAERRFSAG